MTASQLSPVLPDIPPDVLDEAVDWLVKLRSGRPDTPGQLPLAERIAAWRASHPLHELAWQELEASETEFSRLMPLPFSSAQLTNTLDTIRDSRQLRQGRRKALRLFGLGATGVAIGAMTTNYMGGFDRLGDLSADYFTEVGEQRTIALADGTQVKLNTNSAFDVRYSDARRLLFLRHGEVYVDTGKDPAFTQHRPFWVQTAQASLQALGTQFVVQQDAQRTRLAVTEGRVAIYAGEQLQAVAQPGDIFLIDGNGVVTRQKTDTSPIDPTGWIDSALVVKQMPLGQFVRELGRYRRGWLRCSPEVAGLLVSGVFQINNTDLALEALARSLPIAVERHTRFWVMLRSQPSSS